MGLNQRDWRPCGKGRGEQTRTEGGHCVAMRAETGGCSAGRGPGRWPATTRTSVRRGPRRCSPTAPEEPAPPALDLRLRPRSWDSSCLLLEPRACGALVRRPPHTHTGRRDLVFLSRWRHTPGSTDRPLSPQTGCELPPGTPPSTPDTLKTSSYSPPVSSTGEDGLAESPVL